MAILNYTTKVLATKTVAEIQQLLAKAGCQKVLIDYRALEPTAVTFAVTVRGQVVYFTLPANVEGVLEAMQADLKIPASRCTTAQAQRVAWRIIKDWCEAQMALVAAGQAHLAEVFLPYAQLANGQTLYQAFEAGGLPLLGPQS